MALVFNRMTAGVGTTARPMTGGRLGATGDGWKHDRFATMAAQLLPANVGAIATLAWMTGFLAIVLAACQLSVANLIANVQTRAGIFGREATLILATVALAILGSVAAGFTVEGVPGLLVVVLLALLDALKHNGTFHGPCRGGARTANA